MYNQLFSSRFRIVSKEKGTKNRKIFAVYVEGVSNITGNRFYCLKMEKFRLYKKDVFNLSMIQKELYSELFLKEESKLKEYLYSSKNNILSLNTCRISKL